MFVGDDPNREGCDKTPERFEKPLKFLTSGLHTRTVDHILNGATFSANYDEMVVGRTLSFQPLRTYVLPFSQATSRI